MPCLCEGVHILAAVLSTATVPLPPELAMELKEDQDQPPRRLETMSHEPSGHAKACLATACGLLESELQIILDLRAPVALLNTLFALHARSGVIDRSLHCVEFFAGRAAVAQAFRRASLSSFAYDIKLETMSHDILHPQGFIEALRLCLALVPGGLAHLAPVCSTWVWMSRGSTGRTLATPLGSPQSRPVAEGNRMVARVALLLMVLHCRAAAWILEQPGSSLMLHHPRLQYLKGRLPWHEVRTSMGAFGAPTPKATVLYASDEWALALGRKQPQGLKSEGVVKKIAKGRVQGGPRLKATQEYPDGYGEAVLRAWRQSQTKLQPAETVSHAPANSDEWQEADLRSVAHHLQISSTVPFWEL